MRTIELRGHRTHRILAKPMPDAYDVLAALHRESADVDLTALRPFLWRQLPRLDEAVQSSLARLGHQLELESASVYVADPRYRQGATAVLLDYRFDTEDPFCVRATCLLDHGQIGLRVVAAPVHPRFDAIRRLIEPPLSTGPELALNRLNPL